LVHDRLWFYSAFRTQSTNQSRAGLYQDVNPTDWVYTPDYSRQLENRIDNPDMNTRLTLQLTPKNKLNVFFQSQDYYQANRNFQNVTSNEATNRTKNTPNTFGQVTWKSTASSRLLLEAGVSTYHFDRDQRRQENVDFTIVPAQELGGQFPGIFFRSSPSTRPISPMDVGTTLPTTTKGMRLTLLAAMRSRAESTCATGGRTTAIK